MKSIVTSNGGGREDGGFEAYHVWLCRKTGHRIACDPQRHALKGTREAPLPILETPDEKERATPHQKKEKEKKKEKRKMKEGQ